MIFFIFFSIIMLATIPADASCTQGKDGNWYSDEDPFVDAFPGCGRDGARPCDFRLKPGSCPIDKAMPLPEVQVDFFGTTRPQGKAPDIGAVEFIDTEILEKPKDFTTE